MDPREPAGVAGPVGVRPVLRRPVLVMKVRASVEQAGGNIDIKDTSAGCTLFEQDLTSIGMTERT